MKLHQTLAEFPARTNREEKLTRTFARVEQRLVDAHATSLGYPYNLSFSQDLPQTLHGYQINNLGDPYAGSNYGSAVYDEEQQALAWLMRLWGCLDLDQFWGAIGASGTEGNLWGIYLGREMLPPDAVLLHGADAHYSVPKAARILRIPAQQVASLPNGEMDMADFAVQLRSLAGRPVIAVLTCGTMMTGAHDNIAAALLALQAAGYEREGRYIHVDGALNAMVLPFLQDVPTAIQPSFEKGIDSLSTCGHKMIGTPMPCGALVARKMHIARIKRAVSDQRSHDTTLMGSRDGHAVLAIWARFFGHGYGRFAYDALQCLERATLLAADLAALGVPVLHNPFSLTVVLPEPADSMMRRYQLAAKNGQARVVVMPSVTNGLLEQFVADYATWWRGRGRLI